MKNRIKAVLNLTTILILFYTIHDQRQQILKYKQTQDITRSIIATSDSTCRALYRELDYCNSLKNIRASQKISYAK